MKKYVVLFLVMLIIFWMPNAAACECTEGGGCVCPAGPSDVSDKQGTFTCQDGCTLIHGGTTVEFGPGASGTISPDGKIEGRPIIRGQSPTTTIEAAPSGTISTGTASATSAEMVTHRGTRETRANQVVGFTQEGTRVQIQSAEYLKYGSIEADKVNLFVANGDGKINIGYAEKIKLPEGILTKVRSYFGSEIQFHIDEARDVYLGCIALRQVRDSDFKIDINRIEITTANGVEFDIADCGFAQNHFKAYRDGSKLIISKSKRPNYVVERGELKCHSLAASETVEANISASVQYGSTCFSCMDLAPGSTYLYNSEDLRQDFAMQIPGSLSNETYKLCLKKQSLDYFTSYDGLVDFIDKEISLTKRINYLRYPFLNDDIASVIMDPLLQDKENARVRMKMDDEFVFVQELSIALNVGENAQNPLKTITLPSNFMELREKTMRNGTHRLLHINFRLDPLYLQQERVFSYATSYFEPKLKIANNTAIQQTRLGKITILPDSDINIEPILAG